MINEQSLFPNEVDPMSFFQDVDLDHKELMDRYKSYIVNGNFKEAENFLMNSQGLHGYFAQLFNAFENRVDAVQTVLQQMEHDGDENDPGSPFIYTEDLDAESTDATEETIWI